MRVASIICENLKTSRIQIAKALPFSDIIELRLDFFEKIDIVAIEKLQKEIPCPVIFTLRKKSQGGKCDIPERERLLIIQKLAMLSPDYLDLEFDTPLEFLAMLQENYPTIKIIGSYHDFTQTPANLEGLFQALHHDAFSIFKIATYANNLCDMLRLLIFLKNISKQHQIIGIAMGEYGQASRILAPVVGSLMTYGSVDETSNTAPGQLTLSEMTQIYRVHLLNHHTKIYALLGYPVIQSPGHLFHNHAFVQLNKNAVYVKLKLSPEMLPEAMTLFRQLPFSGFSVTIPHKETVVSFLDEVCDDAKIIHAVNTIKRQNKKYLGLNTDGIAGLDILSEKMSVQDKKILILGAGGSAKAIAHALLTHGAKVTLCNRTLQRAQVFTQTHGGEAIDFSTLFGLQQLPYAAIINTLPAEAFSEQCGDWIMPSTKNAKNIAMDIVLKPLDTPFLQLAKTAGYTCIKGDALFVGQALRQLQIWFDI